jgi:hypothetical protein
MSIAQFTVKWEGDRVIVIRNGELVHDVHWQAALEIAAAMIAQARKAEEWANKDRIVIDQAILVRAGSSLPLATHPKIQAEALQQSRWNSMLRRFMPNPKPMPDKIGHLQVLKGKLP